MKLSTKSDYQIAANQYIRGFLDKCAFPGNQPNSTGAGARYYLEGFADAQVNPRRDLADLRDKKTNEVVFASVGQADDEGNESGREFILAIRECAAKQEIEVGTNGKDEVPRIHAKLTQWAEGFIAHKLQSAQARAIAIEMRKLEKEEREAEEKAFREAEEERRVAAEKARIG